MNRQTFFSKIRSNPFRGKLSQDNVEGMNKILDEWDRRGWQDLRWLAYMLATTFHETDFTMQPIHEAGGKAYLTKMYDIKGNRPALARRNGNTRAGDGPKYCGRGYVQLTWKNNYAVMTKLLKAAGFNVDLVSDPDEAMRDDIAAFIMFEGMLRGIFTGKKLADYIKGSKCDYVNARRIINGTDRASAIAGYARTFESCLNAAAADSAPAPVSIVSADAEEGDGSEPSAPHPDEISEEPVDDSAARQPAPGAPDASRSIVAAGYGEELIKKVQVELRDNWGYTWIGIADGKLGKNTKDAILAFRGEHKLPLSYDIDDRLLAELSKPGPASQVAAERAEATPKEAAQKSEAVKEVVEQSWWSRMWAKILAFFGIGTAATSGGSDASDFVRSHLHPILEFFSSIPPWLYGFAIFIIAVVIWLSQNKVEQKQVQNFRDRKVM